MARTQTLTQLQNAVLQRVNLENSGFITLAELTEYINQSIADLYNKILASKGMDYYEKTQTFTTVGNQPLYPLSTDFYELILAEAAIGTYTVPLQPFQRIERGRLSQIPLQAGILVTLTYSPVPPRLVNPTDSFDGFGGFEEYVTIDAAMKCREKEDLDCGALMARRAMIDEMLLRMIPDRDAGMPARVSDVTRSPRTPYAILPRPRYRIHGTAGIDGSVAPNIELVQGPWPGGVF